MEFVRRIKGGVAIAVFGVATAVARGLFITGRTDELPDLRVGEAALGRRWKFLRRDAARRRRARVVEDPINQFDRFDFLANEIGRDQRKTFAFIDGNSRAIDARAKTGVGKRGGPVLEIGEIIAGQAATFFDIEKNYSARQESFLACGSDGGLRVGGDSLKRVRFVAEFAGSRAVEEREKSPSLRMEKFAFIGPGIGFFAGRFA